MKFGSILSIGFYLFFCSISYSQKYSFSLGVSTNAFFYESYNKSDWNNRPKSLPDNPSNFNGYAFGIAFAKPITDYIGLECEPAYSYQFQMHKISIFGDDPDPIPAGTDPYGHSLKTEFEIIKLPAMISYSIELGYKSGLFLKGYVGGQVSYLSNYSLEYKEYYFDVINQKPDKSFLFNRIYRAPNYLDQKIWDYGLNPPGYRETTRNTDFFFTRWLLGGLGGLEFQKNISNYLMVAIGGRVEYDFTNSEKHPELTLAGLGGLKLGEHRAKSHNLRNGLNLSISYLFEYTNKY